MTTITNPIDIARTFVRGLETHDLTELETLLHDDVIETVPFSLSGSPDP